MKLGLLGMSKTTIICCKVAVGGGNETAERARCIVRGFRSINCIVKLKHSTLAPSASTYTLLGHSLNMGEREEDCNHRHSLPGSLSVSS
jgi:hypothetical protein